MTSNVSFINHSSIPFAISVEKDGNRKEVGTCVAHNQEKTNTALSTTDGVATKKSSSFSVPMDLLTAFATDWARSGHSKLLLSLSPHLPSSQSSKGMFGALDLEPSFNELSKSDNKCHVSRYDVTCRADPGATEHQNPFVDRERSTKLDQ